MQGLVTAGVPIGGVGFQRGYAWSKLAEHEYAHEQLEKLTDVQAAYLLLRYSLSVRFQFLIGMLGPVAATAGGADSSPTAAFDARLHRSLSFLLTNPQEAQETRMQQAAQGLDRAAWMQAQLRAKDGGLTLTGADTHYAAVHLARSAKVLPYIIAHAEDYNMTPGDLSALPHIPFFDGMRHTLQRLHDQSSDAELRWPDLQHLLSDENMNQHLISEGVYLKLRSEVLSMQKDDRQRARVLSAGGHHAGSWLAAFPVSLWTTARGRHYSLALNMRLGRPLPELLSNLGTPKFCGASGCAQQHDVFGFHPSMCRAGNRWGLWTVRHDAFQMSMTHAVRRAGRQAVTCSQGSGNWLGAAAVRRGAKSGYKRTDFVMPNFYGPGRHLFVDNAITCPTIGSALTATPSSAVAAGVAADQRAAKKSDKYARLAQGVDSFFAAAVVERFGACSESLVGLIKMIVGDRERDALRDEEYTFSTASCSTHMASQLVFAAVMADAAMIERVLDVDGTQGATPGVAHVGAPQRGAIALPPTQRQIEGSGGRMFYEASHW